MVYVRTQQGGAQTRQTAMLLLLGCILAAAGPCAAFHLNVCKPLARISKLAPPTNPSVSFRPLPRVARTALGSATASASIAAKEADVVLVRALDTIKDYVNEKHVAELVKFAGAFTPLGDIMRKKNFWSGDAFSIRSGRITRLDLGGMSIAATCIEKDFFGREKEVVEEHRLDFKALGLSPPTRPSEVKRRLIALCNAVGAEKATGSIFSIPVDDDRWVIPQKLFLNNVPHTRFARQFFYNSVVRAVVGAIDDPACPRRMQIKCLIPETNASFDTYRIGTVLELVRDITLALIAQGARVKVCVQGKMGQGVFVGLPISLNGCRIILENMDWQSDEGEEQEGIIGTKLFFGEIGPEVVEDEDDVFLLISPQNLIGASLMENLEGMANKAGDRPLILLNPQLRDRPSSNNLMQIRGREERREFANSFKDIFVFETEHEKSLFKIVGAKGRAGHNQPYVIYRLKDNQDTLTNINERREEYEPTRVTEVEPEVVLI